jgi:hypothetical protein
VRVSLIDGTERETMVKIWDRRVDGWGAIA